MPLSLYLSYNSINLLAGRDPQEATALVPGDVPKQRADTMMDHTVRQESRIEVQLKEHEIQDATGIRSILQGSCATLPGFRVRIDEETKIKINPPAKHDEVVGKTDAQQVAEMHTQLCTTYCSLIWSTVVYKQGKALLLSKLAKRNTGNYQRQPY